MISRVLRVMYVSLAFGLCGSLSAAGVAWSPYSKHIDIWEPFESQLGHAPGDAILAAVTGSNDQGYVLNRRTQNKACGLVRPRSRIVVGRQLFDGLPLGAGILFIHTHGGEKGEIAGAGGFKTRQAAEKWYEGGIWGNAGLEVYQSGERGSWEVYAHTSWVQTNWKPLADKNGLFVVEACFSNIMLESMGGRTRFGYFACTNADVGASDFKILFGRMNGSSPADKPGSRRRAGAAFDPKDGSDGTLSPGLKISGEGDTTLCPSVEHPTIDVLDVRNEATNNVFPTFSAGQSGNGHVTFDTHCNTSFAAADILDFDVTIINGSALDITKKEWWLDYQLTFKYETRSYSDYKVTVTVGAVTLEAAEADDKALDGGGIQKAGVAPNADDFVWSFKNNN